MSMWIFIIKSKDFIYFFFRNIFSFSISILKTFSKLPKEKLKFLAETKRIFFLNISTGLLYKKVNTLPYVIMEDIYISKADTYIEQTSFPECYEFRND